VQVQDSSHPPVYYLVDFNTHRADIIGEAYPALDNMTLGTVRSITYQARDGTQIPAYLTLPPGANDKDLAMVVLPHDGPREHDSPEFNWFAQFLALRGYAVLQPEFRGSTGFGGAFEHAGIRQWGGLMQDDVTDGVRAMIRQGIANPRRICIVGVGYGGYAALAGAAFTPDLYACAVSINGIADLPGFLAYHQGHDYLGKEANSAAEWVREIGTPLDPSVIAHSPVNAVADIKAPVLLLHATEDATVPFGQAQAMADALNKAGKRVTLIKIPGDDASLSRADTRLTVLQDTQWFLHEYLN
jgi:dipeptidyl aminopeptidase/acylaminoacyl peptidase